MDKRVNLMFKRIVVLILVCVLLTSCSGNTSVREAAPSDNAASIGNKLLTGTSFENLRLSEEYNIRQFEGTTLNFIVENNLYANILSHESEEFSEITGINVKIRAVDFDTLVQKVNLDFISQAGEYQLVYVDPYQTLNRFYDYLEVLNPYNKNSDLPKIEGFLDDFFENQTTVSSYFEEDKNIYTVPFDSTTMIFYYRKDIFDKYRDRFYHEKGYDWTPGTSEFTWERYYEVAKWIDDNVPNEEVKYGSGLMAQQHNSIFCEFSNILASYGGDYFSDNKINTLGLKTFDQSNVLDQNFIQALDMYKKIASVSAPKSVNWNWTDLAGVFQNGDIAMMVNWDENYTFIEDKSQSKVSGKVGYSILPYGDVRSANIYGGSGIGINKYASETEKQAAWLYIVWATSKDMQLKVLKHPEGGSLPTRTSAYEDPVIYNQIKNPEIAEDEDALLKHMKAVLNAWMPENLYLRPKISNFYDVEKVLITNLHNMIEYDLDSKATAQKIHDELEQIKMNE
jgi:multiple sugar transport system substrate-binding protein